MKKSHNYIIRDTYGFITYYVDDVREEYINYFEDNIDTAHAQYLFEKDLL